MKTMTVKMIIIGSLLVFSALPLSATVTYIPARPNVEQPVAFQLTVAIGAIIPGSVEWRFGDGTTASGPTMVTKAFTAAGSYIVRVTYYTVGLPNQNIETVTVSVEERRRIIAAPNDPLVNQPVTLIAQNFLSGSVRWNFGDGTPPVLLSNTVTHAYDHPAAFVVQARDLGGGSVANITVTVAVRIDPARRRIAYSPDIPVAGRPVAFRAENFYTDRIKWDFGDGTPAVIAADTASHVFRMPGVYTVRAWDWGGDFGEAVTRAVVIGEDRGARAPFSVSFVQIRFDDGKSYKVVAQNFRPLLAYADLRYEGTGLFQAQWLLDGQPFGITTKSMPFYDFATIDSGELPGLPTQGLGMHEVSLRILQPQTDLEIPVIRYFVAADEGPELKRADVNIIAASGLEGVECSLEQDILHVPGGSYAILSGNIRSRDIAPVRWALLRIYIGTELTDQQLFKNLGPSEKREFVTSIFKRSSEPQTVYVTLYDITRELPELLYFGRIALQKR